MLTRRQRRRSFVVFISLVIVAIVSVGTVWSLSASEGPASAGEGPAQVSPQASSVEELEAQYNEVRLESLELANQLDGITDENQRMKMLVELGALMSERGDLWEALMDAVAASGEPYTYTPPPPP